MYNINKPSTQLVSSYYANDLTCKKTIYDTNSITSFNYCTSLSTPANGGKIYISSRRLWIENNIPYSLRSQGANWEQPVYLWIENSFKTKKLVVRRAHTQLIVLSESFETKINRQTTMTPCNHHPLCNHCLLCNHNLYWDKTYSN